MLYVIGTINSNPSAMKKYKQTLLDLNNAYIFFCASVYLGMFWSLHFFWFPNYPSTLTPDTYYDAIIPQTDTATKYFFITIPIMSVCIIIMLISEWRKKLMWVPILWIPGLLAPVVTQQAFIETINNELKTHLTDPVRLQVLLKDWMFLNDVRFVILALMWGVTMYYFIAKARMASANK
jgi:hypothetical protein